MLIGITGKAGAGKNAFGDVLAKEMGIDTYALAYPIKSYINYIFGWDEKCSEGVLKEEIIYTRAVNSKELAMKLSLFKSMLESNVDYLIPDYMLLKSLFLDIFSEYQILDNGFMQWCLSPRIAYQRFGTEFAREHIADSIWVDIAPKENVVWTDLRFPNEAKSLIKNKGIIIEIERPSLNKIAESSHLSENGIGDFKIYETVINNKTLKTLERKAKALARNLNKEEE